MMDPFRMDLEESMRSAIERHLASTDGKTPPNLAESIRYSLYAPGKRIRPRLLLACAQMVGIPFEAALPPALALEMIHCFTLIHDDLPCMDNDDFRRGKPSNHKVFGESIALLAGDALMAIATEVFLDSTAAVDARHLVTALRRFTWAAGPRGAIGGQAAEPLLGDHSSLQDLETMHAQKTGALFSAALLIPMDLSGIAESTPRGAAISRFAAELGLAFQVADDIEDATSETDPTSILHFMPLERARERTRSKLRSACDDLSRAWGTAAAPLVGIAQEVLGKL